jgi:hypothetical protein
MAFVITAMKYALLTNYKSEALELRYPNGGRCKWLPKVYSTFLITASGAVLCYILKRVPGAARTAE